MSNNDALPRSIASGAVPIPNNPEGHVLSDGRRVLDTSQGQALFGAAKDRNFWRMLTRIPGLSEYLTVLPRVAFTRADGGIAYGYEASFVMDVCLAYQRAFLAGALHPKQKPMALEAMAVVAACGKVGLEALIDEAAGHKAPSDYLRGRLAQFLRDEFAPWEERWTPDVIAPVCKLYRKPYTPGDPLPKFMQGIEGMVYDLVIGEDVMAVLRERNPDPEHGHNHHQRFQDRVQAVLKRELLVVAALAETSTSRRQFWHRMRVRYRGDPLQLDILN
jgi:hypothetical protein